MGVIRRLTALLVLSTWITGMVLPLTGAHARVLDDVACGVPALSTPHPIQSIEAARPLVDDGHCATCHLQRAIRGALASASDNHGHVDIAVAAIASSCNRPRTELRLDVPCRAPPAQLG